MARDIRQLSQTLGALRTLIQQSVWQPAVDILRTRQGWLMKFELAGVRPEDIEVRVSGKSLTVSGTRFDWSAAEAQHSYSMEITYSQFERTVPLPCEVEPCHISTEYRDGMLLVRVSAEGQP